jgi:hypothetical protein
MSTASKRDKVKENEVLASKSKLSGTHERAQSTKTDCHEYMKGLNPQKQAVMSTLKARIAAFFEGVESICRGCFCF